MNIRPATKEYVIDLQASEEERWSKVIRRKVRTTLRRLGPCATLAKTSLVLEEEPVFNEEPHQMTSFDPGRGEMPACSL